MEVSMGVDCLMTANRRLSRPINGRLPGATEVLVVATSRLCVQTLAYPTM